MERKNIEKVESKKWKRRTSSTWQKAPTKNLELTYFMVKDWILPSKMGNEAKMSTLSTLNQYGAEVLAGGKRQKETKGTQLEKIMKKNETAVFEDPKESIKQLVELITEFSKVTGYKTNT